jgi:myo-inositol 2-dehydrogenase/D-chiro-inositol 1-dehydrogenase
VARDLPFGTPVWIASFFTKHGGYEFRAVADYFSDVAARLATQKKRCFLVDYQLPTQPPNLEVANRIRDGALGRLAHILSYGLVAAGGDPPKGATVESRFREQVWTSDIALGGDNLLYYDIHIIDGVTWVTGKRPVAACGQSRICRSHPHGDRTDCSSVVFQYEDGVIWNHATNALSNNCDMPPLTASFFGMQATGRIQYWGKACVRGGPRHCVGEIGSIYDDGVVRNVADFYRNITGGHFENPTARRAVDGTLTAILGREAASRRSYLTMDEVIKENKKLEVDSRGLKV